jgi:hypothetical protein
MAPTLFKLIPARVVNKQTVTEALTNKSWVRQIRGGLSVPVIADCLCIWRAIQGMALTDAPDQLIWRWAPDGKFTVHSTYEVLLRTQG